MGAGSSGAHQQVLGTVHGGGGSSPVDPVIESNFRDGVYKISGSAVTLADVWEENLDFSPWSPYTITPGLGYVKSIDNNTSASVTDLNGPLLKAGLFGTTIDLTDGFTVLFESSCVYSGYALDDTNTLKSLSCQVGLFMFDLPDRNTFWDVEAGPDFSQERTGGSNLPPGNDHFVASASDQNVALAQDAQSPLQASPAVCRMAVTFESNRMAFSLNGRPVQTTAAEIATTPTDIFLRFGLATQLFNVDAALEYVAFYPKFANDADLQTLTSAS